MDYYDLARAITNATAIADMARRAEALADLCRRFPEAAAAWFNYANTLMALHREADAAAALVQSMALDPEQKPMVPRRLRELVFGLDPEPPPEPPPRATPLPPSPLPRVVPPQAVMAPTLIDPVESRIGRATPSGLRLDRLLARTPSHALYAASSPGGPRTVRQLLQVMPESARRAFVSERELPLLDGVARLLEIVSEGDAVLGAYAVIAGEPLSEILRAGPLSKQSAVTVVRGTAQILEQLRQHGVTPSEVHPEALFWDGVSQSVTLVGAGASAESAGRTTVVALASRTSWATPEGGLPGAQVEREQVYALGLLLLVCLVGGTIPPLSRRIANGWPGWIEEILQRMPARAAKERWAVAVTSIAKQCLANRPEDRPQSPAQVASALAAAIGIAAGQLKGAAGTMWDPVGALVGAERHAARREEKRAAIDRKSQRLWAIVIGAAVLAGALLGLALQHVGR